MPTTLTAFEGKQVTRAAVKITRAGDGLSEALTVAPKEWHHGDEVYFVLRGEVVDVQHPPSSPKDLDLLVRKHVVVTQEITEVAKREIKPFLDQAKAVLTEARDKAAGREAMLDKDGKVKPEAAVSDLDKARTARAAGAAKRTRKAPAKKR